ncbi:MAG TPA: hypothetical protein VFX95_01975, partial [Caulobacteraceae bacterium]|nr:hypothetical protein [Caulobacteraceae bacterium]
MSRKIAAALCAVALAFAGAANAQTHEVDVQATFTDGRHTGCALNFDVVTRDFAYLAGAVVQGSGSFNLYSFPDQGVMLVLKLG